MANEIPSSLSSAGGNEPVLKGLKPTKGSGNLPVDNPQDPGITEEQYNSLNNFMKTNADKMKLTSANGQGAANYGFVDEEQAVNNVSLLNNPAPSRTNSSSNVSSTESVSSKTRNYDQRRDIPDSAPPPEKKKGFFGKLLDILLAPFKWLLGLFGIGTSKSVPKLNRMEMENGRPISKTPKNTPDTGEFGPYPVKKMTIDIPTKNGKTVKADVYVPQTKANEPLPLVFHSYGLGSNKENHAGTAKHYASWGMVTIVPQLPNDSDKTSENSEEVANWVKWAQSNPEQLRGLNLNFEHGVGLSGHSFGGLTSIMAGATPGVGAIVALDPADQNGKGKAFASNIKAPSAFIMGDPALVNQLSNGSDIYKAAGGNKEIINVQGAKHMDFENSHEDGPKNEANKTAMRHAVGFMLYNLTGLEAYKPYASGNEKVQVD
mgnify:CR=1 FL=1